MKKEEQIFRYHWIPEAMVREWADENGSVSCIEREDGRESLTVRDASTLFTKDFSVGPSVEIPECLESFTSEGNRAGLQTLISGNNPDYPDVNPFWAAAQLVAEMYYKTERGHGVPGTGKGRGEMTLESLIECDKRIEFSVNSLVDLKYDVVHAPDGEEFVLGDEPLYIGNALTPEITDNERDIFSLSGAFFLVPVTPKRAVVVFDASVYFTRVDSDKRIVLSPYDVAAINIHIMNQSRTIAVRNGTEDYSQLCLYLLHAVKREREPDSGFLSFLGIIDGKDESRGKIREYCLCLEAFRKDEIASRGIEPFSQEADEKENDFLLKWIFSQIEKNKREAASRESEDGKDGEDNGKTEKTQEEKDVACPPAASADMAGR